MKFGASLEVHFRQAMYCFETLEVKNPTLQMLHKSKLKQGSCTRLKQTG